MTFDP